MKKVGIALVVIVLMLGAFALGTMNASKVISIPTAKWTEGNDAAQAWREYSASLEAAGARIFAANDDPGERIEGLEYLAQLASASLEIKLAKGSRVHPQFTDWMGDYRKFLGDSPDAIYHTAELSPAYRYEISGSRGDAEYLGFMLYGQQLNGWNRAAANLSSKTINFDEAGRFTLLLSKAAPTDPEINWLELEDDIHMIMVRQYYHSRDGKTVADFTIRNLDGPGHEKAGEEEVATRLRDAAAFFNDTLDGAITLSSFETPAPGRAFSIIRFERLPGGLLS